MKAELSRNFRSNMAYTNVIKIPRLQPLRNGATQVEFTSRLHRNAKIAKNPLYESSSLGVGSLLNRLLTHSKDKDSAVHFALRSPVLRFDIGPVRFSVLINKKGKEETRVCLLPE